MASHSYGMYLAYFVQALVGLNVLYAVAIGDPGGISVGIVMFVMGMIPYIITKYAKIKFPWFIYFLISLAILIHLSGYIQGRYYNIPNWDNLAHLVSGFIVSLLGFLAILFWDKIKNYNLDALFIGIFTLAFGMIMEYLWEMYEFAVDTFFGGSLAGPMQANNADTMSDMIFVFVSGVIVALICYTYVKKYGKEKIMHEMVSESPYFKE
jgi:hypothetical protein